MMTTTTMISISVKPRAKPRRGDRFDTFCIKNYPMTD
jgi:hypothetical protein